MKDSDSFIHDIDNLSLLLQIDEILKHTKRPVDFDKPDNESVMKFYKEFYDKHCNEKEIENEL
jgi:hypothetical protein